MKKNISVLSIIVMVLAFFIAPILDLPGGSIYSADAADLSGTAYAVLNGDTGELDFIRSTESHENGSTGTVLTTDGKSFTGTIYTGFENTYETPWNSVAGKVKQVKFINNIKPTSTSSWFSGMKNCLSIDMGKLDTSDAESMSSMFKDCSSLTSLDVSNLTTGRATTLASMFNGCSSLTALDASNFYTMYLYNISNMFKNCSSLTSLDISNLDTSEVASMRGVFSGCSSLTSLDVSSFKTSNVWAMAEMFNGCSSLTSLDVSNFDTGKVEYMDKMFYNCPALSKIVIGPKFTVASNHADMFPAYAPDSDSSLKTWGLGSDRASDTYTPEELPDHLTAGTWYAQMNYDPEIYVVVADDGTAYFVLSRELHNENDDVVTETVTSISDKKYTGKVWKYDLWCWNNRKEYRESKYTVSDGNIKKVDFVDKIQPTQIGGIFCGLKNLKTIENLDNLDTSQTKGSSFAFAGCESLTGLDLSHFNTSKMTNMVSMFYNCSNLTAVDLSSFDTSKVTSMKEMFSGCTSLSQLDISNFDTGKNRSLKDMFKDDVSLSKISLGSKFVVPSSADSLFVSPLRTFTGKSSTGAWGLGSESAAKTYAADELTALGKTAGALEGTWYAQNKGTYTVKFDPNGGTGAMEDEAMVVEDTSALPANSFKRDGYRFAGWNTEADGTGTAYEDKASVKDIGAKDSNVTLYAQWKKVEKKTVVTKTISGGPKTGDSGIGFYLSLLVAASVLCALLVHGVHGKTKKQ